jgi:hypothetical protein
MNPRASLQEIEDCSECEHYRTLIDQHGDTMSDPALQALVERWNFHMELAHGKPANES